MHVKEIRHTLCLSKETENGAEGKCKDQGQANKRQLLQVIYFQSKQTRKKCFRSHNDHNEKKQRTAKFTTYSI